MSDAEHSPRPSHDHSPRPWRVARGNNRYIVDVDGDLVAEMSYDDDATRTVHCVNAHDRLVVTLQEIATDCRRCGCSTCRGIAARIEAELSKAGEGAS